MYVLACALPPSPQRAGILRLLALADYRERARVEQAQATMDLTPRRAAHG